MALRYLWLAWFPIVNKAPLLFAIPADEDFSAFELPEFEPLRKHLHAGKGMVNDASYTVYSSSPYQPLEFFEALSYAYDDLIAGKSGPVNKTIELKGRFHLDAAEQAFSQPLNPINIKPPA